jgi:acetylornithine deacetylase/succinyl-diaminopimelate desuccinylase-like protein
MKRFALAAVLFSVTSSASAQQNPAAQAARIWRAGHEGQILEEFLSLVSLPNVTSDRPNVLKNAELIKAMLERRGVTARLVTVPDANPVVFGELKVPNATRTVLFYAHYDGQPLDPAQWTTPPFQPTFRTTTIERGGKIVTRTPDDAVDPEWRLYARSAADDKAPIMAMLSGLDAIRSAGLRAKSNIKFVFEGEEEALSINLERILSANKSLFAADVWLICDSPVHQSGQQLVAFGARGAATLDITVYGPKIELHSGHYGNWAPNPAMQMAQLLGSMTDATGHVAIDHFYDGIAPLGTAEREALAHVPQVDSQLRREFWLGSVDGTGRSLAEMITLPSLNVRGLESGHVGAQASNVIPARATASIDIRLVKGIDARQTIDRVTEHIRRQGFFVVDTEPSAEVRMAHPKVALVRTRGGSYNATRTPMDLLISQDVIKTLESARGSVVLLPNIGGSVPLDIIERALTARTILVPIVNFDNNQHTFDENLRIQNLWDGIEVMAALLTM